ncbi:MAG: LamG domain-containing protein [Planctomycetia bacterium]|nr:LamG domain-containing protein [Planctomycetia bacterium]
MKRMIYFLCLVPALFLSTLLTTTLFAVETAKTVETAWDTHVAKIRATDGLVAYFTGDDFRENGDLSATTMTLRGKTPWEKSVTENGISYVSLDDSTLETLPIPMFSATDADGEPVCKAFSVEVRFRSFGQGTQLGGNNAQNGMIFCQSDGYWSGLRVVCDSATGALSLNIGKRPSCVSTGRFSPYFRVYDGNWHHLCATWNGTKMGLYLDGILIGSGTWEGAFTPQEQPFRVGFGNAGVGSLKMDVCECAVFSRALSPTEIFGHALNVEGKLTKKQKKTLSETLAEMETLAENQKWADYQVALEKLSALFPAGKSETNSVLATPATFLRRLSVPVLLACGKVTQARGKTEEMLQDETLPISWRAALAKSVLPSEKVRVSEALSPKTVVILEGMMKDGVLELSARQNFTFRESKMVEKLARSAGDKEVCLACAREFEKLAEMLEKDAEATAEIFTGNYAERDRMAKIAELRYRQGVALIQAGKVSEAEAVLRPVVEKMAAARELLARVSYKKNGNRKLNVTTRKKTVPEFVLPENHVFGMELNVSTWDELTSVRDKIRAYRQAHDGMLPTGGVKVTILPGIYRVTGTFRLEAQDAGTEETPILYTVSDPEKTCFTGGLDVTDYAVSLTENDPAWMRFTKKARRNIYAVKLDKVPGFAECLATMADGKIPAVGNRGGGSGPDAAAWVQLYATTAENAENLHTGHHAELLTLARYPNDGFLTTKKVIQGLHQSEGQWAPAIFTIHETDGDSERQLTEKRLAHWKNAKDAWLFGSWTALWTQSMMTLKDVDLTQKTFHAGSGNVRENHPFFVLNVLEELDAPGEWYLDRESGTVYFWKGDLTPKNARFCLSLYDQAFIEMDRADWTIFEGLTLELGSRCAAKILNGYRNQLVNCTIRNFGTWGVVLNGRESGLYACTLQNFGGGGVQMHGGKTTPEGSQPAGLYAENTEIDGFSLIDLAYTPAFHMDGTGNRVTNCKLHNSPHHVFRVEGMEHTIEFCEVYDAVYQGDDQGAIDMWGNPALRGHVFRNNYWHHIGTGCLRTPYRQEAPSMTDAQRVGRAKKLANSFAAQLCGQGGIRLDDAISRVLITGNVFQECSSHVFGCVQIHGGKDNLIDNNLFIGSVGCISLSPWSQDRWLDEISNKWRPYMERVTGIKEFNEKGMCPLMEKYPDLATIPENPNRNYFTRNLVLDCEAFFLRDTGVNEIFANTMLSAKVNDFCPEPDREKDGFLRFTVPDNSPLFDALGMEPIRMSEMGLYPDGRYR